jgi:hypothetical protein
MNNIYDLFAGWHRFSLLRGSSGIPFRRRAGAALPSPAYILLTLPLTGCKLGGNLREQFTKAK